MRYSQAEKMEVIRMVEESGLYVKRTLKELDINRRTFYGWYLRYVEHSYEGLADHKPCPNKFWNRIPEPIKDQIVTIDLEHPEKSPRELVWYTKLHP